MGLTSATLASNVFDMTNTTNTKHLFDLATGDKIGPATADQIEASFSDDAGETGAILIDADGDVVVDGTWEAQQPGVRAVYVA